MYIIIIIKLKFNTYTFSGKQISFEPSLYDCIASLKQCVVTRPGDAEVVGWTAERRHVTLAVHAA